MRLEADDQGQGPVVVLLHGFPMDRSLWRNQTPVLAARRRVIAPDLRGHGASPVGDEVATMDLMADDVLETLESLGVSGPFVVGGFSMGGYVAESLAVRYPEQLLGLMLLNTRAAADTPEGARGREELVRLIEREGSVEPAARAMFPKLFSDQSYERRPEVVAEMGRMIRRATPRGVVNALRGLASRPDRTADLPTFRIPTLVLAGVGDKIVPVEESRAMAAAIPGARFVEIEEAGHVAPWEAPEETNREILAFLNSIEGIR